jgi:hypothetical protein
LAAVNGASGFPAAFAGAGLLGVLAGFGVVVLFGTFLLGIIVIPPGSLRFLNHRSSCAVELYPPGHKVFNDGLIGSKEILPID